MTEVEDLTKIDSSFAVITNDKDFSIVTRELGLKPDRSRQKGEQTFSSFSPQPILALHGLWEISHVTIGEEVSLSEHINHYQELLGDKLETIAKLKTDYQFECVFYLLITTEYGQAGFDLGEDELTFINKISNRFTTSFLTVENLEP